jgi:hypothetical protein
LRIVLSHRDAKLVAAQHQFTGQIHQDFQQADMHPQSFISRGSGFGGAGQSRR